MAAAKNDFFYFFPVQQDIGKEVILVYDTGGAVDNDGEFYTDSNGRQFIRRLRNKR